MKRHETLQPLSREHQKGLVLAKRLRDSSGGSGQERDRALAAFTHAWNRELMGHFADEERIVGPLVSLEMRSRLLAEHAELRTLAAQAAEPGAALNPAFVEKVGRTLHDHIRWEERELFEAAQETAPDALDALHPVIDDIHARRPGSRPYDPEAGCEVGGREEEAGSSDDATSTP
ncbi:MAG: hypothetical protein EA422_12115 [Gemmatimonadales bacterium]|nr:MAG: hypothetical protein EA422_12115 [Gemmatimonadales bacterium]